MAHKNGAGAEAVRVEHFRPYMDPADVGKGEEWIGKPNQQSMIWQSDNEFTLFVHDGFTPGGHPVDGGGEGIGAVTAGPGIVVTNPSGNTYQVRVRVSTRAGNALSVIGTGGEAGVFVAQAPEQLGVESVDASIQIAITPEEDAHTVRVRISAVEGNQLRLEADGLYVPAGGGEGTTYGAGSGISIGPGLDDVNLISVRLASFLDGNTARFGADSNLLVPPPLAGDGIDVDFDNSNGDVTISALPTPVNTQAAATLTILPDWAGDIVGLVAPTGAVTVNLATQVVQAYPSLFECTIVRPNEGFNVAWPAGVTVNAVPGPNNAYVRPAPDGVVLKRFAANNWFALGDFSGGI